VRVGAVYFLIVAGPGAGRVRSSALLLATATLLGGAGPVRALPLTSDQPATSPATAFPIDSTTTSGISVWNFLHPGTADREQPAVQAVLAAPKAYVAVEPRWEAAVSLGWLDCGLEADDTDARPAGSAPRLPRLSSPATHRSVRQSSGRTRGTRTDPDTDYATTACLLHAFTPAAIRVAGEDHTNPKLVLASRWFRPPRVEVRLGMTSDCLI
jgi:hypothetical protein